MRAHSSVPVACSSMAKIIRHFYIFLISHSMTKIGEMFCSSCGVICEPDSNFCHACGCRVAEDAINNIDEVITDYFYRGFQYSAIIGLLKKHHRVDIHVRTLKRKLKELGLKRREANYNEETVRQCIEQEMQEAGSLAGYRYIWHALRLRHQLNVPRRIVSTVMKEIDPDGVRARKARRLTRRNYVSLGPNFTWHIDGTCTDC